MRSKNQRGPLERANCVVVNKIILCENVRILWNVTDFGSITNGEIKINVINAHVRTVLEVTRSRISHHILQRVVSLCSL